MLFLVFKLLTAVGPPGTFRQSDSTSTKALWIPTSIPQVPLQLMQVPACLFMIWFGFSVLTLIGSPRAERTSKLSQITDTFLTMFATMYLQYCALSNNLLTFLKNAFISDEVKYI